MKNLKILLLLMFFAFSGQESWGNAGTWFNFRASLSKEGTGEGRVYGSFTSKPLAINKEYENVPIRHRVDESNTEGNPKDYYTGNDVTLYLFAIAEDGSEFVEWQDLSGNKLNTSVPCDAKGNETTESSKYGYAEVPNFHSYNICGRYFKSDEGSATEHEKQHNTTYRDNYYNRVDAYYVAVFRKLENDPIVTAEPLDEALGLASFSPGDNQIGDIVTIATHPTGPKDKGYENKFLGWQHNGEFLKDDRGNIIRDNPYSFEVTENNGGVYYAVYESGYLFHRIRNYVTEDFLVANSDNVTGIGAVAAANALANDFSMENDGTCKAGSIYQIHSYKNTDSSGRLVYDLEVQNKHTKDFYSLPSIYIRLNQDADKNAWNFSTSVDDGQGSRLRVNEEGVQSVSAVLDDRSLWYIEPMDKDLETKENYFSLDPAKLVQVGDKYYTTLRTSWNILYNPEQMTPYVVTSVDEETGTFEMEPITGNIIPLGTPVIIETKSVSVEENRMVPTTTAFTGTKPATNLLTTSEKYFPNQSVSGNYKALMVNEEGQLAFGDNALSTVNGNEAYLLVANDVALKPIADLPTLATLKAIESTGDKGKLYTVEDGLVAVAFAVDEQEECALLWCKDQAESNAKTEVKTGQTDYMKNQYAKLYNSPAPEKWDQSNWVAVKLVPYKNVGLSDIATRLKNDVVGHVLKPKAVTGTYSDDVNYTIAMAMPEQDGKVIFENMIGDEFTYSENLYCTANFLSENLVGENGVTQSAAAEHYYFVNPKIQEVAEVTFAVWNGSYFVAPAPQEGTSTNESEINGAFNVDWRYNSYNINTLASNKAYQFMAVVQKPVAVAGGMGLKDESEVTPMDCTPDGTYMVFPLNLDPSNENQVITSIAQPVVSKTVSRVMYYNLMGVASAVPFQGVNIVVTEYSDGSRQVRKVVMK